MRSRTRIVLVPKLDRIDAMYVCVCNAVTDREIAERVRGGAETLEAIRFELGVATCCGQCADCAVQVIDETLRDLARDRAAADEPAAIVAIELRRAKVLLA
jgi:bacterioferritin-associated ferredoxin